MHIIMGNVKSKITTDNSYIELKWSIANIMNVYTLWPSINQINEAHKQYKIDIMKGSFALMIGCYNVWWFKTFIIPNVTVNCFKVRVLYYFTINLHYNTFVIFQYSNVSLNNLFAKEL